MTDPSPPPSDTPSEKENNSAPQEIFPPTQKPGTFDDSHPDDRFNTIKQGQTADLSELAPTLKQALIGVGWDLIGFDESVADLDLSLFLLDKEDLTREDSDFIFYGNEETLEEAIKHTGDSRTGAGTGDDEQIFADLSKIPFDVAKIMVVLTIYDPDIKGYSFNNVRNVYMRVEDKDTEQEIFRYFLDEELKQVLESENVANGLSIGYFERKANSWVFHALGEVDEGGLARIATKYGLVIATS